MTDLLTFMGNHPFLTLFILWPVAYTVRYTMKAIAYMVRPDPKLLDDKDDEP